MRIEGRNGGNLGYGYGDLCVENGGRIEERNEGN